MNVACAIQKARGLVVIVVVVVSGELRCGAAKILFFQFLRNLLHCQGIHRAGKSRERKKRTKHRKQQHKTNEKKRKRHKKNTKIQIPNKLAIERVVKTTKAYPVKGERAPRTQTTIIMIVRGGSLLNLKLLIV